MVLAWPIPTTRVLGAAGWTILISIYAAQGIFDTSFFFWRPKLVEVGPDILHGLVHAESVWHLVSRAGNI